MDVHLHTRILTEIERDLGFGKRAFRQEEGGYLLGRFDGRTLELVAHTHDPDADRTAGSIRFRESHLDYATELCATPQSDLYVAGTWHVHPPGYGAHYSHIDAEYLFAEHACLRAGGLDSARLPQAHLILPWESVHRYRAFVMQVELKGVELEPAQPEPRHVAAIERALQAEQRSGLLSLGNVGSSLPYTGQFIAQRLGERDLAGFFFIHPYASVDAEVERIYIANFINHVRRATLENKRRPDRRLPSFLYYRICLGSQQLQVIRLRLTTGLIEVHHHHANCEVHEQLSVELYNPDAPSERNVVLGVQAGCTVGDVGERLRALRALDSLPLISAMRPAAERSRWINMTHVDEFGEVFLPEDTRIETLLKEDAPSTVVLQWRSPELRPELVYELRTQRLRPLRNDLERLRASNVVVAGLGLLGCDIARLLAVSGIGSLVLIDQGRVDFTNVYRQQLYETADVFQWKVHVARRRLVAAGVKVDGLLLAVPTVTSVPERIPQALRMLEERVAGAGLVIGTLDCFSGRAVLQALCLKHKVPFLSLSVDLLRDIGSAQGNLFLAMPDRAGCYACSRRLRRDHDGGNCTVAPIELASMVSAVGLRWALELLDGRATVCRAGQVYAGLEVDSQTISSADSACELCGPKGVLAGSSDELGVRIQGWLAG